MNTPVNVILESVEGAALISLHLLTPFLRSYRTHWGAVDRDIYRIMPGDALVRHPKWQFTHAITIAAPASEVWKWLVQIGANRGGLYSYDGLENLAGCHIHNADHILREFQTLKPGDEITLHPQAPGMHVAEVVPERYILVHNDNRHSGATSFINMTWLWYLEKIDETTTRLITRSRNDYSPDLSNRLWMGPLLIEPISFVMERKMLLGIRECAEAGRNLRPLWAH
jgi:hypothetical protein